MDPSLRRFSLRSLIFVSIAVLVIGLTWLACELSQILLFVFAGLLFAVLLHGIADFITRKTGLWRHASLSLVVIVLLGLIGAGFWFIGPRLATELQGLAEAVPRGIAQVRQQYEDSWIGPIAAKVPPISKMLPAPSTVAGELPNFLSTTTEIVAMTLFVFFLGIYAAADPALLLQSVVRLVPPSHRGQANMVAAHLGRALGWWFVGRIVTMIIMGALTALGLWLLNMKMALSLGIIAGLFQFVPYLGAIAAAVPALLIAFTISPFMAVKVAALYVGIHLAEGYAVTPLIQQRAVAIPPAALLTMQVVLGTLFGLMGVLLASPLTVVLIVLVQTLYLRGILGDRVEVLGKH